jgi:hemoglobin
MDIVEPDTNRTALPRAELMAQSVYDRIGGDDGGPEAFAALVDAFYDRVEDDPVLRPMYPDDEGMAEAREKLALFLMQFFGGPALYAEKRGHPRLRMRHVPFAIGPAERDAWLRHMNAAIDSVPALAPVADTLRSYFKDAANFLQNRE